MMKSKGYSKGGKTKGYSKGGKMKTKGYSKGGAVNMNSDLVPQRKRLAAGYTMSWQLNKVCTQTSQLNRNVWQLRKKIQSQVSLRQCVKRDR